MASIVATFLAASNATTPLYAVSQADWHFTPITTTVVFGVYAIALLAALLTLGRLSDHVGRRPVLLDSAGVLHQLPASTVSTLTSRTYLPHLLSGPFHSGLIVVFIFAAVLAAVGAVVSLFRGGVFIQDEHIHDEDTRVESDCV